MRSVGKEEEKKNHLWLQAQSLRYALESLNGAKQLNQWIASFCTHLFNCNMSMSKTYHINKLLYLFHHSSLTATHAPTRKNKIRNGKRDWPCQQHFDEINDIVLFVFDVWSFEYIYIYIYTCITIVLNLITIA